LDTIFPLFKLIWTLDNSNERSKYNSMNERKTLVTRFYDAFELLCVMNSIFFSFRIFSRLCPPGHSALSGDNAMPLKSNFIPDKVLADHHIKFSANCQTEKISKFNLKTFYFNKVIIWITYYIICFRRRPVMLFVSRYNEKIESM
jgi:hypothetical protein